MIAPLGPKRNSTGFRGSGEASGSAPASTTSGGVHSSLRKGVQRPSGSADSSAVKLRRPRGNGGFSSVEALIATTVLVIATGGTFLTHVSSRKLMRAAFETEAATTALRTGMEEILITSRDSIEDTFPEGVVLNADDFGLDSLSLVPAGSFYTRRKFKNQANAANVRIRRFVDDPLDRAHPDEYESLLTRGQLQSLGISSTSGLDSDFQGFDHEGDGDFFGPRDVLPFGPAALELFQQPDFYAGASGNTLLTNEHGVNEISVPPVDEIASFVKSSSGDYALVNGEFEDVGPGAGTHSKGTYHSEAGLTILTSEDGSWTAYDADGTDVSAGIAAAVSTGQLFDGRQDARLDVTTIDIDALNQSGHFPANGLLYTATYGIGEGADVKGTVITNGSEIAGDLSIVTEGALYMHGDFNTVASKPAAVVCDALNLLSNSWDNSKGPGGPLPRASATTYNMSLVAGNLDSLPNQFNGELRTFHGSTRTGAT